MPYCCALLHTCGMEQLPQLHLSNTVLMFPSDGALLPDQLDLQQLHHVVILDSKWRKARELNQDKAFEGIKRMKLPGSPRSRFWRFHTGETSDEGVCTIEALHLLLQALAGRLQDHPCQGDPHYFDNLLWYFAFQH
eukprot:GHRR01022335.1.p2 GENE.GHRR01022335.1~~GHRR01022335.1.p2  ORF type:complete len:136 (+),score=51.15 GHRR01022335.1:250-657(+)